MNHKLLSVISILFIFSCGKKNYDEFELSYGNTFETDFSLKFTQNDTIYIRENWSRNDINENSPYPKSNTNYYAIISKQQNEKLNQFLKDIDFKKYDTAYHQNYVDGSEYKFYIKTPKFQKSVYVHSHNSPKELDSLAYWIVDMKRNLKLLKTNKKLNFKSKIYLPPPPLEISQRQKH